MKKWKTAGKELLEGPHAEAVRKSVEISALLGASSVTAALVGVPGMIYVVLGAFTYIKYIRPTAQRMAEDAEVNWRQQTLAGGLIAINFIQGAAVAIAPIAYLANRELQTRQKAQAAAEATKTPELIDPGLATPALR